MVAKLPKDVVLEELLEADYTYTDFVEMLADMRRLRRLSGWHVTPLTSPKDFAFNFAEAEHSVSFRIPFKTLAQSLWPSRYPDNPEVPKLRQLILGRRGEDRIAALVNTLPKSPPSEGPSLLDWVLGEGV